MTVGTICRGLCAVDGGGGGLVYPEWLVSCTTYRSLVVAKIMFPLCFLGRMSRPMSSSFFCSNKPRRAMYRSYMPRTLNLFLFYNLC